MGQSTRFVLEYTGEEYVEKLYGVGPPPTYDRTEWLSEKFSLGLKMPNLPYYINGDTRLTQSYAILRHLGRKHDLCGTDETEMHTIDMLMEQGRDMRNAFVHLCYKNYNEKNKNDYIEKLPTVMKMLSSILGCQKWFVNDKISLADFVLYEELYVNKALHPSCLEEHQNLKDFMKRFETLPAIQTYMESSRYKDLPINGPMAGFVGQNKVR